MTNYVINEYIVNRDENTLMCRTNIVCSMHKCVFAFKDILPDTRSPPYQSFVQKKLLIGVNNMKGNKNQIPINGKLIDVSDEVYEAYIKDARKMKYFEYDLKNNKHIYDENGVYIDLKLCREESLERMIERKQIQLYDNKQDVEDIVEYRLNIEKLHKAISKLTEKEQKLIKALYFEDKTEREYAKEMGLYRNAIHVNKVRILKKLKDLIEDFNNL